MSLVPDIPRFSQSAVHESINELKLQRVLAPYDWTPGAFANFSVTAPSGGQTTVTSAKSAAVMRIADLRDAALAELDRYARYTRGWDGYRGEPVSARLLTFARLFVKLCAVYLQHLKVRPLLITTGAASDGSLDIEIQLESKRLILTFYDGSTEVQAYRADSDGETFEAIPLQGPALVNELSRLAT